jgi:hypothetical protein
MAEDIAHTFTASEQQVLSIVNHMDKFSSISREYQMRMLLKPCYCVRKNILCLQ